MPDSDALGAQKANAVAGVAVSYAARTTSAYGLLGSGWTSGMSDANTLAQEVVATSSGNGSQYARQPITMGAPTGTPAKNTTNTNAMTFPNTGTGSAITGGFIIGAMTGSARIDATFPVTSATSPAAGADVNVPASSVNYTG